MQDELAAFVEAMFTSMGSDHNGTVERDELLNGYLTAPLITKCFAAKPVKP